MKLTKEMIIEYGYDQPKQLPNGEWAALMDMLFTTGLFHNLDTMGYECRWCYATRQEAVEALENWEGIGKPTGEWLAEK